MLPVTITPVTIADSPTLLALSRKLFFDSFSHLNDPADMEAYASAAFTLTKFEQEINQPGSAFYFAYAGDDIAGYLKLNTGDAQTEFKEKDGLEIERIYVDGQYQGNKIGQQLLNFVLTTATETNMRYLWLGVWEHNEGAKRFYNRHGFTVIGSHPFVLGRDLQTDLIMRKEL